MKTYSRTPDVDFSRFEARFTVVDTHTVGEFTRVVVDGIPEIPGGTMIEKRDYIAEHFDDYRKALMFEPRGHKDMFGAFLTAPVHEEADFGVVFMESECYPNMCGHGTIGSATAAVEAHLVPVTEPYTEVVLDAPAGLVRTRVKVENGKAVEVTLTNVPAFLYKEGLEIDVDGRNIKYDISFGGQFFPMVDVAQLGLEITSATVPELADIGIKMLEKISAGTVDIQHPTLDIHEATSVEFYGKPLHEGCDLRNVVVFGKHQADRSPCGTGTSAKLAMLYSRGEIGIGETLVNESFIGTRFKGVIVEETMVGPYRAVIPEITGSAYVTGVATYLIDPTDPLKYGFVVGE